MDVDANDIVGVQNTVHQQILNCQVEDLAIDDAIYILGDALRRDIISTEVYLKRVRNYSRKQFYTRALIDKCREIAGLDVHENDCPSSEKQENSKNTKVPNTSWDCHLPLSLKWYQSMEPDLWNVYISCHLC